MESNECCWRTGLNLAQQQKIAAKATNMTNPNPMKAKIMTGMKTNDTRNNVQAAEIMESIPIITIVKAVGNDNKMILIKTFSFHRDLDEMRIKRNTQIT
jgi:pyridoxal/pyridoxine/pyridoxamine kinase